jgi:hypothetical protein
MSPAIKIKKEWTSASTWYAVANADGKTATQMAAAAKVHAKKYPRHAALHGVTFYVEFPELFGDDRGANWGPHEKPGWATFVPQTQLAKDLVAMGGKAQMRAAEYISDFIECDGFTVVARGKK